MSEQETAGAGADAQAHARIDKLLDAIELVKANRRSEARHVLRDLIREDNDFEDAWLWMSVAVDSLDQSSICLDNVLRINSRNVEAAGALYRISIPELEMERRRNRFRFYRDLAQSAFWFVILLILLSAFILVTSLTP